MPAIPDVDRDAARTVYKASAEATAVSRAKMDPMLATALANRKPPGETVYALAMMVVAKGIPCGGPRAQHALVAAAKRNLIVPGPDGRIDFLDWILAGRRLIEEWEQRKKR